MGSVHWCKNQEREMSRTDDPEKGAAVIPKK